MSRTLAAGAILAAAVTLAAAQARETHVRLFPPAELGILEGPDRDEWQQPDRVMDALGIADGSRVADLGAGGGWFTTRLARRVGPNGIVYAEDIQHEMIESIRRRVDREGLKNVETLLGAADDPHLPPNLHAILIVDTYTQFRDPVSVLRRAGAALAPAGRLGIVDFKPDGSGGPGPALEERVAPEVIERDAALAGLKLHSRETFLRYQYLLVFTR
ncbi:MAG TPA: methyltransferase domain-containing protein [Vicinamibacterales bacterium]|nr:methyltransferase domain-containing protein [Vicinamibacterales bacterium]